MSIAPTFEELFDPDFLSSLTHLSITARRVAAGGRFGEKLSRDLGSGMEFLSASMYGDDGVRIRAALKAALAMAAISMNQNDTAGLVPFGDDLRLITRGETGKVSIMRFARHLAALEAQQQTNLAGSLETLSSLRLRPGLLLILSDFFDPAGLERFTVATGKLRHRMLWIQITRPSDAAPTLQGELRLRDCETGEVTDIAVTPAVLKRCAWMPSRTWCANWRHCSKPAVWRPDRGLCEPDTAGGSGRHRRTRGDAVCAADPAHPFPATDGADPAVLEGGGQRSTGAYL